MKRKTRPMPVNIKFALLLLALLIAASTFFYTQNLVKKLQARERRLVELYAKGLEYITDFRHSNTDFTFIFENIIKRIDFPLILTDANDNINLSSTNDFYKNIEIDSSLSKTELKKFFEAKIRELRAEHSPITVTYKDSVTHVLTKIYYGDSDVVRQLKYYPYLQIFFAIFFVLMAYIGFSHVKKNEQSNIWVGMAKETAHQLGTPISSLMGWLELLRINYDNPDKVLDLAEEMENDLARLNKITKRFSKIGSKPDLKNIRIDKTLEKVTDYFKKRLPQTGKNVKLVFSGNTKAEAFLNPELFEWVIENLIKNSLDAIEGKEGKIEILVKEKEKEIEIYVKDDGKGIDMQLRKEIFRPGYSTKKRGWGLGLSLTKRIVEDYHKGKIVLLNSEIGKGTTFKITLKKAPKENA